MDNTVPCLLTHADMRCFLDGQWRSATKPNPPANHPIELILAQMLAMETPEVGAAQLSRILQGAVELVNENPVHEPFDRFGEVLISIFKHMCHTECVLEECEGMPKDLFDAWLKQSKTHSV